MATPANIQIGRALFDGFEARDLSRWEALMAANFTCSYPGFRGDHGKEAAKAYNSVFPTAFPDLRFTYHKTIADGDTVVYIWTATGTHNGPLALPTGIVPPTGKQATVSGVLVSTIKDGKIVREESYWNQVELLAQLGLM